MTRSGELEIGTLGGLPSMALGPRTAAASPAPPLVVLPGLSPEHAPPSGPLRWAELGLVRPFAGPRRVLWLARRPGLPAGTAIADVAADLAAVLRSPQGAAALAGRAAAPLALDAPAVAPVPGAGDPGPSGPADASPPIGRPIAVPPRLDVLGVSTGGSIALQLAVDHPDLVRRLVLVSSAARLGDAARAHQRAVAARARAGSRRRALALLTADLAPPGTLRAVALAAAGWALGPLAYPAAGDLADLATVIEAEDAFDLHDRLGELRAPTLLVAGGRDRAYPPALVERTARAIPDARLVRYPRRGHVTVGADPRFVARVERFLRG